METNATDCYVQSIKVDNNPMTDFSTVMDFDSCIECKPGFEKVLVNIADTESVLFLDERGT
ncbi:MAG: hypothetical protein DHS20C13_28490 [Thermodesulfobacteriota bacterium]|nr:MAG: hypothetical protein DHS20C13_28490 [Thermodesulfobacteriota bacterium]